VLRRRFAEPAIPAFVKVHVRFITRLLINAAALWAAIRLVSGISFEGEWPLLFAVALVFGVLNALIRPILFVLTLPFFIVTLGLFTFVLNAFMLWLTSAASDLFGLRFHVDGFGAAFLGALIVTIVSFVLSALTGGTSQRDRAHRVRS